MIMLMPMNQQCLLTSLDSIHNLVNTRPAQVNEIGGCTPPSSSCVYGATAQPANTCVWSVVVDLGPQGNGAEHTPLKVISFSLAGHLFGFLPSGPSHNVNILC